MSTKRQSFMEGALILMVAGFLVKVIGAIFKIPLYNVIGGKAMAYFTVGYDVYVWMYVITTAGLPVAISRMVSESNARGRYNNAQRILYVAFSAFLVLGVAGCCILFFGADTLAGFMKNPSAAPAIRVIAPAILFEIVMSSYRGYFQGNHNMLPTAISQIIVAIVKLGGGIVAANYVLSLGLPEDQALPLAAAAAISGVTLGTLLGAAYLMVRKLFFKPNKLSNLPESRAVEPYGELLRRLIMITVPIAIGSMVSSVSNLVDTALIMSRLLDGAGFSQSAAETVFGTYSGMTRTMFNLPSALIIPIGVSVIPAIAEKFIQAKKQEASEILASSLRVATLMAMPAGFEWPDVSGAWDKLEEECTELKQALHGQDAQAAEHELGDALFALVSVARKLGVDAEEALTRAGERFTERFARMEELAADWDKPLHALSPEQQMELWDRAKRG